MVPASATINMSSQLIWSHSPASSARDGKRQAAGDHGARGHDGVGDVGLVEAGVTHELQEEQRDDGSENNRPGECTHLEAV